MPPPPPPPDPTAQHRALAHPSRVQLLDLVRGEPDGVDATELARRSGLHPNTVRVHLGTLATAGLVEGVPVRLGGRGRPATRYHATEPAEDGYRLLAEMLATALSTGDVEGPAPAAEAAGRRWGRQLATVRAPADGADRTDVAGDADRTDVADRAAAPDRAAAASVTELFDRLGFAPKHDAGRIVLHACPYRALATRHPDVVCGLHLGLLRGALDGLGARGEDAWLAPFATPTRCVAGLAPTTGDPDTGRP